MKTLLMSMLAVVTMVLVNVAPAEATTKEEQRDQALIAAKRHLHEAGRRLKQVPAKYDAQRGQILQASQDAFEEMKYLGMQFASDTPDDTDTLLMHARRAVQFIDIGIEHAEDLKDWLNDDGNKQVVRELHFVNRELRRTQLHLRKLMNALD